MKHISTKPPFSETKLKLERYNVRAFEENFFESDADLYAFWAWETLMKSTSEDFIIKTCVKKKFEIYTNPRDPKKTAEQETFEFIQKFMNSRGVAMPMDLVPWREGVNQWHQVKLWKKAVHLLLMSEVEYLEHRSYLLNSKS